ncbi:MAG: ATP synthase F1 subunit delta [Planctomycetaceae bacterium]|nr:ATP synthase F1 subunit delta [Planctomycetaceae bacterium]
MPASRSKKTVIDTARQRIGTVYAKALLGAAEKAGQTDAVLAELKALVEDVLEGSPEFEEALRTPRITPEEKSRLLDRVFGGKMSPLLLNFLKVVSQHERLDCLRAIERAAEKLWNLLRKRIEVHVESAAPISNQLQYTIATRLKHVLGRDVVLTTDVNPAHLGGLVVRVGDTVYDGSLAGRLKQMQAVTLERTTETIRESLEKFSIAP